MSTGHPPYFIGIALPPELSERISSFKWQLHKEIAHSLQPLVPHITLLHPPSLKGISPGELLPRISEIAAPHLPLAISLEGIGAFDSTVLYIGVRSPELDELHARLIGLLPAEAQEIYYRRGYVPHVTLAQVRAPHTLDIESLRKRVIPGISLPCHAAVGSLSHFIHEGTREYGAEAIL